MKGLFWFRNDLRLLDHPLLVEATKECDELLLLYILDSRLMHEGSYGFQRSSDRRNYFTIQGVNALGAAIALRGGKLITCIGSPEEIIPKIVSELSIQNLYWSHEIGTEEKFTAERIVQKVPQLIVKTALTGSLIYPEDLSFLIKNTPEVFTSFRKAVEKKLRVAPPISEPNLRGILTYPSMELPSIGVSHDPRSVVNFEGGEVAALARLKLYLFEGDFLRTYKETRNGLIGPNYSSKLSAWLAQGALFLLGLSLQR
jgi:deoxyribodipyrimidine photo-lyase